MIYIARTKKVKEKNTTLSSASRGRWRRISSGSVSAAITTNSDIPLFRVFVAAHRHTQKENQTAGAKQKKKTRGTIFVWGLNLRWPPS